MTTQFESTAANRPMNKDVMNYIEDVRFGIETLGAFSKAFAEAQHNFHEMDDSDYSAVQRETLDQLYEENEVVFEFLGPGTSDISDWRNLTVCLGHCYLLSLQKELRGLLPANHPKKFFTPESDVLSFIAGCENTILRGFLCWAIVGAHKPSSYAHSFLQIHSADDAAEYMVPKPEGDMQVVLVRIRDLPKLVDLWGQRAVSGLGEEEMVEVCRSNKPNFRKSVTKGLFVLAWKVPGKYEDMWMDGQGFAIPGVPELI
ncbi:hypothetical protein LZL87_005926 [Fusarium oxysporum]|nr:hypothetical protein LZL87_005926 [Fusarium oxysporum]